MSVVVVVVVATDGYNLSGVFFLSLSVLAVEYDPRLGGPNALMQYLLLWKMWLFCVAWLQ